MDEVAQLREQLLKLEAQRDVFERLYLSERERVEELQRQLVEMRPEKAAEAAVVGLAAKLCSLTVKQRASIVALIAGHTYLEVAGAMGVDQTTVKIHCQRGFKVLGFKGLHHFKAHQLELLDLLSKVDLERLCSVRLDWLTSRPEALLQELKPRRGGRPPAGGLRGKLLAPLSSSTAPVQLTKQPQALS